MQKLGVRDMRRDPSLAGQGRLNVVPLTPLHKVEHLTLVGVRGRKQHGLALRVEQAELVEGGEHGVAMCVFVKL